MKQPKCINWMIAAALVAAAVTAIAVASHDPRYTPVIADLAARLAKASVLMSP